MEYKVCSICGASKDKSEFYTRDTSLDGLRGECKTCFSERARKRYSMDRQGYIERTRERYIQQSNKIKMQRNYKAFKLKHENIDTLVSLVSDKKKVIRAGRPCWNVHGVVLFEHQIVYCLHNRITLADLGGRDVHHVDGNKLNNSIENLVLLDKNVHRQIHLGQVKIGQKCVLWTPSVFLKGCEIGNGTSIGAFTEVGFCVKIGKNCKIQSRVFLPRGVSIGNNVFIGPSVTFTNDRYPSADSYGKFEETIVQDGANIGAGATIRCGITIGAGATIGAGSVVCKDVPPNGTVKGVAAK